MGMTVEGFDRFTVSMDKLAALPDSVTAEMLTAGGEVIKEAHQAKLDQYGAVETGELRDSIKVGKPNVKAGYVEIRPTGTRRRGNTVTRNEEIGYITEYGKKGEPARPWMREGNADSEDKAVDAAGKVFDNYLDKIGL
jgi:hypothetical protein